MANEYGFNDKEQQLFDILTDLLWEHGSMSPQSVDARAKEIVESGDWTSDMLDVRKATQFLYDQGLLPQLSPDLTTGDEVGAFVTDLKTLVIRDQAGKEIWIDSDAPGQLQSIRNATSMAEALQEAIDAFGIDLVVDATDHTEEVIKTFIGANINAEGSNQYANLDDVQAEVDEEMAAEAEVSGVELAKLYKLDTDNPNTFIIIDSARMAFRPDAQGIFREVNPTTGDIVEGGKVLLDPINEIIADSPMPLGEETQDYDFIGGFAPHHLGPNPDYEGIVEEQRSFDRFRQFGLQDDYMHVYQEIPDEFRPPQYRYFDEVSSFAGKSVEYTRQVQQQLIDAGLLSNRDVVPGYWGEDSEAAMKMAMDDANGTGSTWMEVLARRSEAMANLTPEQLALRAGRVPFTSPAYLEPDYATLAQAVRRTFSQTLGRDPEDYELALLADQMSTDFRKQYGAELGAARAEYDAGNRAIVEGTEQESGTFQAVDSMARFQESMLTKYGTEIERREDIGELQQNTARMMRNLGGLESMVGG